jgi:hypothetical protein
VQREPLPAKLGDRRILDLLALEQWSNLSQFIEQIEDRVCDRSYINIENAL